MKTVLAALNSKYIHLSLAPWCLKAACGEGFGKIKVIETTVNRSCRDILHEIVTERPDLLGFSCYIFNIIQIERIVNDIKKLLPDLVIVLGGPEVSFNPAEVLGRCPGADYVICGEGEAAFSALVARLSAGGYVRTIPGLAFRLPGGAVRINPPLAGPSGSFPSPYTEEMLAQARDKILYFESSRGCPFHCAYCLSSRSGGTHFFPLGTVRRDLARVLRSQARQIKFVDRTFNCNLPRAKELVRFILETVGGDETGVMGAKNIHFEAAADLFDGELLELLARAPKGLFQLEIGIQSLNEAVLETAQRKTRIQQCIPNIQKLLRAGNIHVHLDLIAGLPGEDYASFGRSFDGLFVLRPHTIQLGFLKLLKGSLFDDRAGELGLVHESLPPYEILCTPCLSFEELSRLKAIAECVERLYNSGRFLQSLAFITGRFPTPFAFFESFAAHLTRLGCFDRALSLKELYDLFAAFAARRLDGQDSGIFGELLKYDYFSADNACNPPRGLDRTEYAPIKALYLAQKKKGPAHGRVHFEYFTFDPIQFIESGRVSGRPAVVRFDYGSKDPVTGLYHAEALAAEPAEP